MHESTLEVQIDTTTPGGKKAESGRMGTRKNPVHFGKGPNVIRNQSEMSCENEDSSKLGF